MMKLQNQISRKYKDTEYEKFLIILPSKIIKKLGWKAGEELDTEIKNNKLEIKKQKQ